MDESGEAKVRSAEEKKSGRVIGAGACCQRELERMFYSYRS